MGAEAGIEPASTAYEAVKAPFLYSAISSQKKATRVMLFFIFIMSEVYCCKHHIWDTF